MASKKKASKKKAASKAKAKPYKGLPRYQSHKTVTAIKIAAISSLSNGQLSFTDGKHTVIVDAAYVDKHKPQPGGYYVKYADGYESWSPAAAFEGGYEPVK